MLHMLLFLLLSFTSCDSVSYDDLEIPTGWSSDKSPNARKPRTCSPASEMICESEYMSCQLYAGPANNEDTACTCAGQFYGICLREAGCAAKRYGDCVDVHMDNDCADMSVCGSNCVGNGNALDLSDARILPVNNFAANYLRLSTCDLGLDEGSYQNFELVRMQRCREPGPGVGPDQAYHICPYWIPPSTFTAVAIPNNSTMLRVEYANLVPVPSLSFSSARQANATLASGEDYVANVLRSPAPLEYYGTSSLWPSSVDVAWSETNYCSDHQDCPGSHCNQRHIPHKCAPKVKKHYSGASSTGQHFKEHSFTDEKR